MNTQRAFLRKIRISFPSCKNYVLFPISPFVDALFIIITTVSTANVETSTNEFQITISISCFSISRLTYWRNVYPRFLIATSNSNFGFIKLTLLSCILVCCYYYPTLIEIEITTLDKFLEWSLLHIPTRSVFFIFDLPRRLAYTPTLLCNLNVQLYHFMFKPQNVLQ